LAGVLCFATRKSKAKFLQTTHLNIGESLVLWNTQFQSPLASKSIMKIGGSFVLWNTQIQSQLASNTYFSDWREFCALDHAIPKPSCFKKLNRK